MKIVRNQSLYAFSFKTRGKYTITSFKINRKSFEIHIKMDFREDHSLSIDNL